MNRSKSQVTGKELKFDSVIEAQHYFNEPNHVSFCRRCKGLILKPYKNKWKVAYIGYEYDKFDNIYIKRLNVHVGSRKIKVYNMENNIIKIFNSYREFEKSEGLKHRSVAIKTTYHKGESFIFKNKYKITLLN